MKRLIIKNEVAKQDLIDIALYLGAENPAFAEKFLDVAEEDFQRLAEMPGLGSPRTIGPNDPIHVRMWPVSDFRNYLIFYQSTDEELIIIRVLHGARDIERILEMETDEE